MPFHVNDPRRQNCKTKCFKTLFAILNAARSRRTFLASWEKTPAQPGERDRPRRGDPAALPAPGVKNRGKDSGEKEGGSDIRAACAGTHTRMPFTLYMSSETHSWHVFSKNFKKFFDRCAINIITKHTSHSECGKTARNAEATILGVLFNIRYGLGLYPDDPILRFRKRQLQYGCTL